MWGVLALMSVIVFSVLFLYHFLVYFSPSLTPHTHTYTLSSYTVHLEAFHCIFLFSRIINSIPIPGIAHNFLVRELSMQCKNDKLILPGNRVK